MVSSLHALIVRVRRAGAAWGAACTHSILQVREGGLHTLIL